MCVTSTNIDNRTSSLFLSIRKQALAPDASDVVLEHRWPVAAASQGLKPSTALDKAGSNFQLRFIAPPQPKANL